MASVYKRTWRGEDGKKRVSWVAAYRDQDGRRNNKGFVTRKAAKAFLTWSRGKSSAASIPLNTPRLPPPRQPIYG
jgi:hypothetical protein